jgi:Kef-type K+ transport system membrane component KefB
MDTLTILFVFPLLIIFSYLFDAYARKTKFPAVILLMFSGMLIRFIISLYGFKEFMFLEDLVSVIGTIGLILIVLEGALELEISSEKLPLIFKGFFAALVILIINIVALSWSFIEILSMEYMAAVVYSIPLSIISSAVAIPSAASLLNHDKEFVVYESTFSDILGIMIFNYALRQFENNQNILAAEPIISLGLQVIGVIIISLVITYMLFRLIQNIEHHVKFFLILALLILVYAFGKMLHLPALVTIFIFGIFLSNVNILLPPFFKRYLDLNQTQKGLNEFHILTAESTFLVRTFFFLFFGFSIQVTEFMNLSPYVFGILIFLIMFVVRYLYLALTTFKINPSPLLYMSPRGLISILLFLQIKDIDFIDFSNSKIDERVLLIVILCSMFFMMLGTFKKNKNKSELVPNEELSESIYLNVEPTESSSNNNNL